MTNKHRAIRTLGQRVVLLALAIAVASGRPSQAAAAVTTFLDIPGLPGESTSPLAPGLIEVASYEFSITPAATIKPPKVAVPCGGSVKLPQANRFMVTKNIDKASPGLLQAAQQGTAFSTVTLHVFDAATSTEYFKITLTNATISSITHALSATDSRPSETVLLSSSSTQTAYVKPGDPSTTSASSWVACIPPGRPQ